MSKKNLRRRLFNESGGICYLCNLPIKFFSQATIDHVVPKSKGGINHKDNYKIAHFSCNKDKADTMPEYEQNENAYLLSAKSLKEKLDGLIPDFANINN